VHTHCLLCACDVPRPGSDLINRTGGWRTSDSPDVRIAVSAGHVDYTDSSFALWRFTGNGPWTGPAGLDADLARNADGTYTMRMHDGSRTPGCDYDGDADQRRGPQRERGQLPAQPALPFGDHRQPRRRGRPRRSGELQRAGQQTQRAVPFVDTFNDITYGGSIERTGWWK